MPRHFELENDNIRLMLELIDMKAKNTLLEKRLIQKNQMSVYKTETNDILSDHIKALEADSDFYKNALERSIKQTESVLVVADTLTIEVSNLNNIIKQYE